MTKRKPKHIHRYERVVLGKDYVVYRCTFPDCTHYIARDLAEGRLCICYRCGESFTLDAWSMKFKKPHCKACTDTATDGNVDKLAEILGDV